MALKTGDAGTAKPRPQHRLYRVTMPRPNMPSYIAVMRKGVGSDYGVDFPDLPGCVTVGRTRDETWRMAAEGLDLHLERMAADRESLPPPSSLDRIMADQRQHEAVAFLVNAGSKTAKAWKAPKL